MLRSAGLFVGCVVCVFVSGCASHEETVFSEIQGLGGSSAGGAVGASGAGSGGAVFVWNEVYDPYNSGNGVHLWLHGNAAAASVYTSQIDLFFQGTKSDLGGTGSSFNHVWSAGDSWTGIESLGEDTDGTPSATSWGSGRLDVVTIGHTSTAGQTTYTMRHLYFDGTRWNPWDDLGGNFSGPSPTAIVAPQSGVLHVFASGPSASGGAPVLLHRWFNSAGWNLGGWENLGGTLSSGLGGVAAVADSSNIDVFALWQDGLIHWLNFNCSANAWGSWQSIGSPPSGVNTSTAGNALAVAKNGSGYNVVFAYDTAGHLYEDVPAPYNSGWFEIDAATNHTAPNTLSAFTYNRRIQLFASYNGSSGLMQSSVP